MNAAELNAPKRKWLKLQSADEQVVTLAARKVAARERNRRNNEIYAKRYPDRVKKRRAAWEKKNAAQRRAYNKQWRIDNPERNKSGMDRWRAVPRNRMRSIVSSRIADARRRGIPVDEQAMRELVSVPPLVCAISGCLLDYSIGRGRNVGNSPSIDRIDPNRGYERGNIAVISHRLNTIKSFGTASEHRMIAEYLEKASCSPQRS